MATRPFLSFNHFSFMLICSWYKRASWHFLLHQAFPPVTVYWLQNFFLRFLIKSGKLLMLGQWNLVYSCTTSQVHICSTHMLHYQILNKRSSLTFYTYFCVTALKFWPDLSPFVQVLVAKSPVAPFTSVTSRIQDDGVVQDSKYYTRIHVYLH